MCANKIGVDNVFRVSWGNEDRENGWAISCMTCGSAMMYVGSEKEKQKPRKYVNGFQWTMSHI